MGWGGPLRRGLRALGARELPASARWAVVPAAVSCACLAQKVLFPEPRIAPFVFFYLAIAATGWLAGALEGLVATAASAVAANYFFIEPYHSFATSTPSLRATASFVLSAAPIALLCASLRDALTRAERTAGELALKAELLHLSHDAIVVWRPHGEIESWNRGAEELYGYRAAEAIGAVSHDLLRTTFPEPLAQVEAALRARGRWHGVLRHVTKDGRQLVVAARLQLVRGADGVERVLETNRDVTEQARAEESERRLVAELARQNVELRESEERFRALADNIPQLAWMADATGYMFWYNRRWFEYTGTTLEETKGWGWQRVHDPDHVDRVVSKLARCYATGEPWEDTFPLRAADGSYRWFLSRAIPIHDAEGKVTRWFGTNTDVTDQRLAEQRKDEFLAMLSHELRNPLAPIRNSLYLLHRVVPAGDRARKAIEVIERQIHQMTRLIADLLDVSRISRGKIQIHRDRVDLALVTSRVIEDHRALFAARRIELGASVAPEALWVNGDADRLYQVAGNLLHNAAKFTPEGGRVDVQLAREGASAVLRVRDTGVGIPADMLATIFEPFTQASQALDRRAGGLGLGLALVKELVDQHGGRVEARSEGHGRGAELTVRLPLDAGAAGASREQATARASPRRRVLVIEDNVDAAESLRDALEIDAHEVAVAFDGLEGVAKARELAPEIVLCDIGLPGMDGYSVARALRGDPSLRGVTLVALTGYALAQDEQRAIAAGFDRHLAKPPDLDELQRILVEAPARRAA